MTTTEYETYKSAVARNLAGLSNVSTGACPGCKNCGITKDSGWRERELAEEPSFSWHACECCGSTLGGNRWPAHGIVEGSAAANRVLHFTACADCVQYLTYGQLDDLTMMEMTEA